MNPGAQSPHHGFETKKLNTTPNEINELSRVAFDVMKMAVYNAEVGLRAQLERSQPEPKRQFIPMPNNLEVVEHVPTYEQPAPVVQAAPAAPLTNVVDLEAYHSRNQVAQPREEVPTVPHTPTILEEDPLHDAAFIDELHKDSQSPEARLADARRMVQEAQGDYPHAA